jgi:hypothetical protein
VDNYKFSLSPEITGNLILYNNRYLLARTGQNNNSGEKFMTKNQGEKLWITIFSVSPRDNRQPYSL